jgi:hypothetical protein
MSLFSDIFKKLIKPIGKSILPGAVGTGVDLVTGMLKRSKAGRQAAKMYGRASDFVNKAEGTLTRYKQDGSVTVTDEAGTRTTRGGRPPRQQGAQKKQTTKVGRK